MNFSMINLGIAGVIGLIGIGFYGLLISRNLIKIIVCLQILVKAALLSLIVAGEVNGQTNLSQSLVITVIVADTVVAVMGMALAVQIKRHLGTLDTKEMATLRG